MEQGYEPADGHLRLAVGHAERARARGGRGGRAALGRGRDPGDDGRRRATSPSTRSSSTTSGSRRSASRSAAPATRSAAARTSPCAAPTRRALCDALAEARRAHRLPDAGHDQARLLAADDELRRGLGRHRPSPAISPSAAERCRTARAAPARRSALDRDLAAAREPGRPQDQDERHHAPSATSRVPSGDGSRRTRCARPARASFRNELRPLISERADDRAPEALRSPPIDEHRERDEGERRGTPGRRDRAELVHEQAAREAGERAADHERVRAARGARGCPADCGRLRILARRPQPPSERGFAGRRTRRRSRSARRPRASRSRSRGRARARSTPGPIFVPVADDVVGDPEHGERRDAGGQAREPHQRDADERARRSRRRARRARATATVQTCAWRSTGIHRRQHEVLLLARRASGSRRGRRRPRRS